MKRQCLVRLLSIVAATVVLGGLGAATANASYPILKLDFGRNDPGLTEEGFTSFTIADSGKVIDGIKIQLGGNLDARLRGAPSGITYELIYRDFIFSRPGGMMVTLSGLNPNTTYEFTIWAFDPSSTAGGQRIADWIANGDFLLTAGFDATVYPDDETTYGFTGTGVTDGTGRIVLEATANPNTAEVSGANNPFAFLNGMVVSSLTPLLTARHPAPADGATISTTTVELQWEPASLSTSSNIYFGEDRDRVANATTADPEFCGNTTDVSFLVGSAGNPYPDGLIPNKTYYWRVDEVDATGPHAGEVWSFMVAALSATAPDPVSGSLFADPDGMLTWTPGVGALKHHVYFGDNLQAVQAGTGGTDKGTVTDPCYPTGKLQLDKTYYWRVDETDATTTYPGETWSFTTSRPGMGTITMELWENILGDHTLVNLTSDPRYPDDPTSSQPLTEFGTVDGVSDSYGGQISGWLYCPLTGDYTFFFSSAGQGELWLSTDDDPANIVLLASEATWGSYDTFSHKSDPIPLVGGAKYYIMARWKDFSSWDHCQVAWQGAGVPSQQIIAGHFLSPFAPTTAYGASPANDANDVEPSRILKWKSGSFAAQHRVFLGTDPNAVRDAGTNSPEYKGTQPKDTESFDPGTLQLETTYYWRIDEVNSTNPASPWIGQVWSFTTGNFVVVDNFESYNDINLDEPNSNRIYRTWSDGWDTPETNGAVVGYPDPDFNAGEHFVETSIIHGGRQSMPYSYDCDKKYSQAVRSLSGLDRDFTREGVDTLSLWYRGYPATMGSFVQEPNGTITMTGSGTDIGGRADEFHFAYKKLTGAGSIVARVVSLTDTDPSAKAAVMIRDTLQPGSIHVMGCVTSRSGVTSEGRIITDDLSFNFAQGGLKAPYWVRLERDSVGNFSMTASADGITWARVETGASQPVYMDSPTVYIGLAVTAHNAAAMCTAVFTDVTITGDTSQQPNWLDQDIGITSNEREPMYVALNGKAVANPDPNAVLMNDWTECRIPLQNFEAQGVDLKNVDTIALIIGTQGNTAAGGSGMLYFDDIRLYRPAATEDQ
jgi:hypothetical protein